MQNLKVLGLRHNNLSGRIPIELGSLQNLSNLFLDSNNLSGRIPVELGLLQLSGIVFIIQQLEWKDSHNSRELQRNDIFDDVWQQT